ncbi:Methyltransferase domain [Actinoalloteichus hymeniacidonis]|uniref:Methyltransferase domain n=3 Tax=Actinoalloteichus hymeniacidonis TaxID=340345 RepID=A0AAC9HQQ2_9PSEU|nr:Methyltransferase domain [Actinoalloteichus hymeniacidonis]
MMWAMGTRSDARRTGGLGPAPDPEPYRVTSEFYDLLHRRGYRRWARRELAGLAGQARHGVVEIGAGTGVVTEVLAEAAAVPVHAVEPSRPMRAVLLSRWAASPPMRRRVRVWPTPFEQLRLGASADLVVCVNLVNSLSPADRDRLWAAARDMLRPGGVVVLDRQGPAPTRPRVLSTVSVGEVCYAVSVSVAPLPDSTRQRWTFRYTVSEARETVREEVESFDLWPVEESDVGTGLAEAGFSAQPGSAGLLVFRR